MSLHEVVILLNKRDQLIHSRSVPGCSKCLFDTESENEQVRACAVKGVHRKGALSTELGRVYLCTSNPDEIKSSKLFKKNLMFYAEMLGTFDDMKVAVHEAGTKFTKRLIHNLTSLHAHILQDLYLLVPQEALSKCNNASEQWQVVREAMDENEREVSKGFLRILKNSVAIKTEFNVFQKLYSDKATLNEKYHSLHRVLKNVASMYFQNFQEKNINVTQDDFVGEAFFDYESMSVALHHLFHNATKYTQNNSAVRISFPCDDGIPRIKLQMTSLPIEMDEMELIYEDGYSGRAAKKLELAGDGAGMGIAKKLLQLNGATLSIEAGTPQYTKLGTQYAENSFQIEFPKKKVRFKQ